MSDLKWLVGLVIVAGVAPVLFSADDDGDRESAKKVEELAGRYEFYADPGKKTKFDRRPEPVLKYTNPVRGQVYGHIYVWAHQGRPEVIGAVFDLRSEGSCYTELHTLARPGVVGYRDGKEFHNPTNAGVTFRPVPGAPVPADTAQRRLLQMREMSRGFSVEREHPEHGKEEMRLMARPLFRYDSPRANVLDGAIFAFVDQTTDPEAFLILEAAGTDRRTWQYAFARMNIVGFRAKYKDDRVWEAGAIEWATVYERQEPYAIVHESTRRGLVRKP